MNLEINRRTLYLAVSILTVAILLLAGFLWWHQPRHHAGRINVSPFETDMIEGLVRELLHENGIHDASVCFLSFGEGGTPPSSAFIARFADCRHPAVRSVDSSVSPPNARFFEKDNGRPGLVIRIIKFNEYISGVFDVTVANSNLPVAMTRSLTGLPVSAVNGSSKIARRLDGYPQAQPDQRPNPLLIFREKCCDQLLNDSV